jgi:tripartite motif-containing protein 71
VAVGSDGLIYVLDVSNRVQVFTPEGEHRGSYEPVQLGLYGPNGIASGKWAAGDGIFVAVTGQSRLVFLPLLAAVQGGQSGLPESAVSISVQGISGFEQPVDVAVDPTGSGLVYAIDLRDRIMQLKVGTGGAWEIVRQWPVPVGRNEGGSRLAVSPDGKRVYMSDPDRKRVAWLDVERGFVSYFGAVGNEAGKFGSPSGVAVGPDGKVYVSDGELGNVQVFVVGDQ